LPQIVPSPCPNVKTAGRRAAGTTRRGTLARRAVTGAGTAVTDTNAAPTRFYRDVVP